MGFEDITKEKILNNLQVVAIVFFAISSTYTLTTIYNRFQAVEASQSILEKELLEEINHLQIQINDNEESQTRRVDIKTERNSVLIKELEKEMKNK